MKKKDIVVEPIPLERALEEVYKLGIREVVEWLENNLEPTVPMSLDYRKWHAKLKEWGVE